MVSPGCSLLDVEISFSRRELAGPFNLRSISDVSIAFLTSSSLSRIWRSWRLNSDGLALLPWVLRFKLSWGVGSRLSKFLWDWLCKFAVWGLTSYLPSRSPPPPVRYWSAWVTLRLCWFYWSLGILASLIVNLPILESPKIGLPPRGGNLRCYFNSSFFGVTMLCPGAPRVPPQTLLLRYLPCIDSIYLCWEKSFNCF